MDTEKDIQQIPYIVYESEQARNERHIKRLIVALIISIALIFASNALWLWGWVQYDYSSEETVVEQKTDDGGNANYIGENGDINNGLPESNNTSSETNQENH